MSNFEYSNLTLERFNLTRTVYMGESTGEFLLFIDQNDNIIFKIKTIYSNSVYTFLDNDDNTIGTMNFKNGTVDFTACGGESFRFRHLEGKMVCLSDNCLNTSEITSVAFNDDKTQITLNNETYDLVDIDIKNSSTQLQYIKNDSGDLLAVYDKTNNKIYSAGETNLIDLNRDFILNQDGSYSKNPEANKVLEDLLGDGDSLIKDYIEKGDWTGLKEHLIGEVDNLFKDSPDSTIITTTKEVINDMELDGVTSYEDFIDRLNDSLKDHNLPSLDLGLEKVEDVIGTDVLNKNNMTTTAILVSVLVATVAVGTTAAIAVSKSNKNKIKSFKDKVAKKYSSSNKTNNRQM